MILKRQIKYKGSNEDLKSINDKDNTKTKSMFLFIICSFVYIINKAVVFNSFWYIK